MASECKWSTPSVREEITEERVNPSMSEPGRRMQEKSRRASEARPSAAYAERRVL